MAPCSEATSVCRASCGRSAPREELRNVWDRVSYAPRLPFRAIPAHAAFLSGILMPRNAAQIERLCTREPGCCEPGSPELAGNTTRADQLAIAHTALEPDVLRDKDVRPRAATMPARVATPWKTCALRNPGSVENAVLVSRTLAKRTASMVAVTEPNRLAIASGNLCTAQRNPIARPRGNQPGTPPTPGAKRSSAFDGAQTPKLRHTRLTRGNHHTLAEPEMDQNEPTAVFPRHYAMPRGGHP